MSHAHAICVYPTSLASLLDVAAELVGKNPRKRKRRAEEDEETPLDFWSGGLRQRLVVPHLCGTFVAAPSCFQRPEDDARERERESAASSTKHAAKAN